MTTRWGILATGRIARDFATNLRSVPDAVIAAVGSRSLDSAEAFARANGDDDTRAHASYADAGGGPRRRRRLRRQPARRPPRARAARLRGRQAGAVREAADAQPPRRRGAVRRGRRPVLHGGHVDGLPSAGPGGPAPPPRRRLRYAAAGARRPRLRRARDGERPDGRARPRGGGHARHGDLPAHVRPDDARAVPPGSRPPPTWPPAGTTSTSRSRRPTRAVRSRR